MFVLIASYLFFHICVYVYSYLLVFVIVCLFVHMCLWGEHIVQAHLLCDLSF